MTMRITRSSTAPIATTNAATTATDDNNPDPEPVGEHVPDSQAFGQDVAPNNIFDYLYLLFYYLAACLVCHRIPLRRHGLLIAPFKEHPPKNQE